MVKNFKFQVAGGRLIMNDEALRTTLAQLHDGDYVLSIKKQRKPRSLNENKYYWGVIIPLIGDYCGYDKEETHEALKIKFLFNNENPKLPTTRSTASLSTVSFEEYCQEVRQWASKELGVYIPAPNEPDLELYFQL